MQRWWVYGGGSAAEHRSEGGCAPRVCGSGCEARVPPGPRELHDDSSTGCGRRWNEKWLSLQVTRYPGTTSTALLVSCELLAAPG